MDSPSESKKLTAGRHRLAEVLMGIGLGVGLWLLFWFRYIEPIQRHNRWSSRVYQGIRSLAHRRPEEVSKGQWEWIVGWTLNLHGNCANVGQRVDPVWRDRLAAGLERRLRGPFSLADIDWIWDEYALHTPYGRMYSDRWRPTRAEGLKEGHEGCFGIPVD